MTLEVAILDYRKQFFDTYADTKITLPVSTKIKDLKKKKIFCGGKEQFPAEKFSLAHEGVELGEEQTLGSLFTPGKRLVLDVHSMEVLVKHRDWELPLRIKTSDVGRFQEIVKANIYALRNIRPDRIKITDIDGWGPYPQGVAPGKVIGVADCRK